MFPNPLVSTPWAAPLAVLLVALAATWAGGRTVRSNEQRFGRRRGLVAVVAALLAKRARRPAMLLALRRLADEPRATARPAGLLFLASLVAFSSSWLASQFRAATGDEMWLMDPYYSQAFALVRWGALVGLLLCAVGLGGVTR